jgi:hypothetical protein
MKNKIYSICIGINSENLTGSKNDSILFYNFLYYLYKNNKYYEYWLKPTLFYTENLNIETLCKHLNNINYNFKYLLIFYSGHGYNEGVLNITNDNLLKISNTNFLKKISDSLKNDIELFLIIDCCYGGTFKILPYNKIKKIYLISSTQYNQIAFEGITTIEQINKLFDNIIFKNMLDINNNNISMGIFTFNFIFLLKQTEFNSIMNWKDVFNNKLWIKINNLTNQKPLVIWE